MQLPLGQRPSKWDNFLCSLSKTAAVKFELHLHDLQGALWLSGGRLGLSTRGTSSFRVRFLYDGADPQETWEAGKRAPKRLRVVSLAAICRYSQKKLMLPFLCESSRRRRLPGLHCRHLCHFSCPLLRWCMAHPLALCNMM